MEIEKEQPDTIYSTGKNIPCLNLKEHFMRVASSVSATANVVCGLLTQQSRKVMSETAHSIVSTPVLHICSWDLS